jgi:chloramphenicol O-acetyltransferase type B
MKKIVKDFLIKFFYKIVFYSNRIGSGSRIDNSSSIGKDTNIGNQSLISKSQIKEKVSVKSKCYIHNSNLGNTVNVSNNCHIYNSTLGNTISVLDNCHIHDSMMGDDISISNDCYIQNTKVEKNIFINAKCILIDVQLGSYSYLSEESHFQKTNIGRFCSISNQIACGLFHHPTNFISTSPVFYSTLKQCGVSFSQENYFDENIKPTIIENDVWIGTKVIIKGGIRIGNGAVVGAGAVVVSDIPDYAIVGGSPAKIIRFRFPPEVIEELLNIKWWEWSDDELKSVQPFFSTSDYSMFIDFCKKRIN